MLISKREAIFRRDERTCVYCRVHESDLPFPRHLTLDHLIPKSCGGGGHPSNLLTACDLCNRRRGNALLGDFVGPERAAELVEQARKPVDYMAGQRKVRGVLVPKAKAPAYPTSLNNKLHDLVRDLIERLAQHRPNAAENMRARARNLGVKFPPPSSGGFAGLQEAIDDGRLGQREDT